MTINFTLLDREIQFLREHPEAHDQRTYGNPCGTAACLAGWTMIHLDKREGRPKPTSDKLWKYAHEAARAALGLTLEHAYVLFSPWNTIDDLAAITNYLREHPDAGEEELMNLVSWADED